MSDSQNDDFFLSHGYQDLQEQFKTQKQHILMGQRQRWCHDDFHLTGLRHVGKNILLLYPPLQAVSVLSPAGYSVASGEFSGDGEEGEGHIYSTENQNAWLSVGIAALFR